MREFSFTSPLQAYIQGLILQKRSLGYKYDSCARTLFKFDQFCAACGLVEPRLTKEVVNAWSCKRPHEAHATFKNRLVVVRQLGLYIVSLGEQAYVLPKNIVPRARQYVPYIFSNEELAKIFAKADACHYSPEAPQRQWIMPILFRMLYGCGLRISEALNLRVRDVDMEIGVLTINDGKLNKSRLVPVSAELLERCRTYVRQVHVLSSPDTHFFPAPRDRAVTKGNAYKNFRKFLWQARISHGGWGKGPRVHDFRHTFAVHCLRRWVLEGKDLTAYLPILKTYLGHHSFQDTSQYLRLTAELYPNITAKVEQEFGGVIPSLEGLSYETN